MKIIPTQEMTDAERLNAITRSIILITIVLYFMGYDQYYVVLLLGIGLVVALHSWLCKREGFNPTITETQALRNNVRNFDPVYDSRPHVPPTKSCWFDQNNSLLNATYEITPKIQFNHYDDAKRSYMNAKYELTPLTDTDGFRQIWRTEPDMCGGYSMVPDPLTQFPVEQPFGRGQCNYIVRSEIDHLPISQAQNGLLSTRPMAEAAYLEDTLKFRNNIMSEHIDRFRRERQHNCPDMKLGAVSAGAGGTI